MKTKTLQTKLIKISYLLPIILLFTFAMNTYILSKENNINPTIYEIEKFQLSEENSLVNIEGTESKKNPTFRLKNIVMGTFIGTLLLFAIGLIPTNSFIGSMFFVIYVSLYLIVPLFVSLLLNEYLMFKLNFNKVTEIGLITLLTVINSIFIILIKDNRMDKETFMVSCTVGIFGFISSLALSCFKYLVGA